MYLTLKEEHRFLVFDNKVLRRIFGFKREEVEGGWTRMHNEEHNNLYTSQNIIRVIKSRRMRWMAHVAHIGEMRNSYKILVRKPEEKRPLGIRRLRHRWQDNIRMDLREID